ncbi:SDR family NAD(P)-dependent oxidoreductase [Rhizobium halophytocola]|uniref:NAD(P)-dependent dehydrogenase (Short-subunit alcohol dehydrogenase family) n=1 Tax=Rhizobium halophytocola TaxID=735519 RepID=A0ABS4E2W9_9HYPH|nr:SDR family NAD(P)-dependent oxidoreductase [Rhizobium halophytocola]MBP1852279.1 NAD(P)-dependent dehydrogenase (short-subunit alcohol dehydrogenase family) [Rhizobium halophytocola]
MSRAQEIFHPGKLAVITGGASGIGYAAAEACADAGMNVVIADLAGERLDNAAVSLGTKAAAGARVVTIATDVGDPASIENLKQRVKAEFGPVHFLMNNAGIQPGSSLFGPTENWDQVLAVNLLGIINGSRLFGPDMIAHGEPAMIVNTGSKQGITTPPGDPAYNVAKAGVKALTEALEHELRNTPDCKVSAHLLIPGFVFTGLTAGDRKEKPDAAWTPQQTVAFMMASLREGDFYILCPDNDVDRRTDELRMQWAIGDIVENRPPLSRWHPDYKDKFAAYLKHDGG